MYEGNGKNKQSLLAWPCGHSFGPVTVFVAGPDPGMKSFYYHLSKLLMIIVIRK